MKEEKSAEFFTCDWDLRTKGDGMETRCLDRQYVGDPMKETMGLRGVPVLWTLGNPYRRGPCPAELRRRR